MGIDGFYGGVDWDFVVLLYDVVWYGMLWSNVGRYVGLDWICYGWVRMDWRVMWICYGLLVVCF